MSKINKIDIPGLKTLSGARDLKYILKDQSTDKNSLTKAHTESVSGLTTNPDTLLLNKTQTKQDIADS